MGRCIQNEKIMTYSVKEIFEEILKESVNPFLKKHGFKRQGMNFRKIENGLTYIINFQSSGYNSVDYAAYYINRGIYCDEFEIIVGEAILPNPKEVDCLFRERIEQITESGKQQIEIIESSEAGKILIANQLLSELEKVISFFEKTKTIDDLITLCIENHTFYYEKIFKYLCLKKDMIRLDIFFQKFGEIFKDDERYIFFESRLNDILVENGIEKMKFKAVMSVPFELQRKP
jgi:Domain of unknown function (DUF4304)